MESKKENKSSKKSKLNSRPLILIVSVAAIIILAIVLIVALNTGKNNENGNNTNTENIGENVKLDEKGDKVNISDKLNSEKKFENYKVGNILLKTENGQTSFTADITNISGSTQPAQLIYITFLDKSGTELSKMGVYIRDIKAGEKISTKATTSRDLTNAYDFKVTKQ